MIPVFRPSISKLEKKEVLSVLSSGWLGMGKKVEQFENDFAKYINIPYAIATNSATAALHLAIHALGIGPGDEVITTPMTFASTTEAILYNGATPVFADIETDTMNIDPQSIEKKITSKTKAIIPVHFGGHPCDMDKIMDIAKKYNLSVIEDAAHACGASYGGIYAGIKVGGLGNLTCFSFHAVKNLSTGDGGMITCNDAGIVSKLKRMRWMGINKDTYSRDKSGKYAWDYDISEQGWKCHMNDITAAIGIGQLKRLDWMNNKRKKICSLYNKNLNLLKIPGIEIPAEKDNVYHARHNYVIKLPLNIDREELIKYMNAQGISLGVHYKPLYYHQRYAPFWNQDTPNTESLKNRIVTLPVFPDLKIKEAKYIIQKLKEYLDRNEV